MHVAGYLFRIPKRRVAETADVGLLTMEALHLNESDPETALSQWRKLKQCIGILSRAILLLHPEVAQLGHRRITGTVPCLDLSFVLRAAPVHPVAGTLLMQVSYGPRVYWRDRGAENLAHDSCSHQSCRENPEW